MEGVFMM